MDKDYPSINLIQANLCWGTFWITYWISGIYLSYLSDKSTTNCRKITDLDIVITNLFQNMFWSWISTNLIFLLPFRAFTDYNVLFKFVFCLLFTDMWFYHTHIMMHHRQLYIKIHKKHHKFQYPYALTGAYCTGYESIICNLLSIGLGPIIVQLSSPYIYIWFILVALNSTLSHSGYYIIERSHDLHHELFDCNYGTLGIFDKLYGTYKD